jgi:hypothetical protein
MNDRDRTDELLAEIAKLKRLNEAIGTALAEKDRDFDRKVNEQMAGQRDWGLSIPASKHNL